MSPTGLLAEAKAAVAAAKAAGVTLMVAHNQRFRSGATGQAIDVNALIEKDDR